jgi:hypothetical protein
VIAYLARSVPEFVGDGVMSFISETLREKPETVPRIRLLEREACRRQIEPYFTAQVMANAYEHVYRVVVAPEEESPLAEAALRTIFAATRRAPC